MGTNFYIRRRATLEEKRTICDLVHNSQWALAGDLFPRSIHIGKRSGGWQFLWNPLILDELTDRGYQRPHTAEQIKDLLNHYDIFDEYGEKFTYQQFWNDEVGGFLYQDPDHLDAASDDRQGQYGSMWDRLTEAHKDCIRRLYDCEPDQYGEWKVDGLRFTNSTQFS